LAAGGDTALLDFLASVYAPEIAAAAGMMALSAGGEMPLLDFLDGFTELELELDCFVDLLGLEGFVLPEGAATKLEPVRLGVKARSPGWCLTLWPLS
jgi:hypothetical protein